MTIPLSYCWVTLVIASTTILLWSVGVEGGKLVDLSHDHSPDTYMATAQLPKYETQPLFDGEVAAGVYAKWSSYSVGEHGGTHLDAPRHFSERLLDYSPSISDNSTLRITARFLPPMETVQLSNGYSLHEIPLENTIADGVMIDCTEEVAADEDYALTLQKIKDWENENGRIPQRAAVLINFNWSNRFNDSSLYFNTNDYSDASTFRFPVVGEEAINFLVDERDINILAVDTMGPDLMASPTFPVHVKMLGNNKIIIENLKHPGRLPPRGFRFHASPVKFVGGTGVQVRAFAVLDDGAGGIETQVVSHIVLVIAIVTIVSLSLRSFL